jgi:predicted DCC family thiol-disulfide oxidoreductase YuxK
MLFDGVCNLCSASVRTVLAMDRKGAIRFTPVQSLYGELLARTYGLDPLEPESFVFFDRGAPLTRSAAMIVLARRLAWPWRALAAFAVIPRPARDVAYDFIARRRYRLFGKRDACFVPSDAERRRFLLDPPA